MYPIAYSGYGRKPIIPLYARGPRKIRYKLEGLVATDFEITVLKMDVGRILGARVDSRLKPPAVPKSIPFEGREYDLAFSRIELSLLDVDGYTISWEPVVAFWDAPTSIAHIGFHETLEWLDPQIISKARRVIVTPNQFLSDRFSRTQNRRAS